MPQLMPLMWVGSSMMIVLMVCVFMNLYYMFFENCKFKLSKNYSLQYLLEW